MRFSKIKLLLFLTLPFAGSQVYAQSVRSVDGKVYHKATKAKKEYMENATVGALGAPIGTQTDRDGKFTLTIPDSVTALIVSFVGFKTDTVVLKAGKDELNIELKPENTLSDVIIREKIKTTEINMHGPIKVENIGQKELLKAACCNLSESFETTPSIDVSFTDAVTGYKQIKMLGLAGPYTLITRENIPDVRGLAAITGLTFTPGTWIESMQLSKGTGSVVNGYESVAGQLNVELRKPFNGERWLFNLYQNTQGRSEANVNYKHKFNDQLGTNLLVHFNSQWLKTDQNKDGFLDQPLGNQFNIINRWIYSGTNGWMFQAGVKFLYADGIGGQWDFKDGDPQKAGNPWGYKSTIKRFEDWAKIARVFSGRAGTSVGLQLSNINHDQDNHFGASEYAGKQTSFYANLIFQTYIGNTNNIIKLGASELVDNYDERFASENYLRNEQVPGVFGEYSYNYMDKFNVVAGLRADNNNIYGAFITPRLHVRYAPFKKTVIRASIGRAQRTANVLAENMGFMAGNRQFNIEEHVPGKAYGMNPEVAWNTGVNLTHKFKLGLREAVLSLDYYYTWFESQVVVDMEYPNFISFYNLDGKSFAHGFQAQFDYELIHNLDLRLAYRYYNVMTTYKESGTGEGVLKEKPLVPPHRAFLNMGYKTRNNWKFDYTIQWISSERTPGITHNHAGLSPGGVNQSPSYLQMSAQISKPVTDMFEVYVGGENLTNYMQHDAIVSANDPFGKNFDASMIWGPMMGRSIYAGFRYKIK
jgi:outer membrane receptor for ferrienterochelin and colicins